MMLGCVCSLRVRNASLFIRDIYPPAAQAEIRLALENGKNQVTLESYHGRNAGAVAKMTANV